MESIDDREFSLTAIDHAQRPRNLGPLSNFNAHASVTGPCGDTMEFWLLVTDGRVEKASFITSKMILEHIILLMFSMFKMNLSKALVALWRVKPKRPKRHLKRLPKN